jgi:hypothetical protein
MRNPESHSGTYGWMALGAFVAAWDVFAPETLSNAIDRAIERPGGRIAVIGTIAITAAHLLNILPEEIDPYNRLGDLSNRLTGN